jgi:hypothetical protein
MAARAPCMCGFAVRTKGGPLAQKAPINPERWRQAARPQWSGPD